MADKSQYTCFMENISYPRYLGKSVKIEEDSRLSSCRIEIRPDKEARSISDRPASQGLGPRRNGQGSNGPGGSNGGQRGGANTPRRDQPNRNQSNRNDRNHGRNNNGKKPKQPNRAHLLNRPNRPNYQPPRNNKRYGIYYVIFTSL